VSFKKNRGGKVTLKGSNIAESGIPLERLRLGVLGKYPTSNNGDGLPPPLGRLVNLTCGDKGTVMNRDRK